ncbi:DUF4384 domain-containing protein [uncultured Cardiobacterium sp.]|uniref:DUF4384 domain-containing protein n=1 Tax=uncultured Cardiobacterium sp. TaxID=417619 RepID=UPI00262C1AE2|nr:DUF4384 domain-containing protein [uncultured Cardiobacterium sp.]
MTTPSTSRTLTALAAVNLVLAGCASAPPVPPLQTPAQPPAQAAILPATESLEQALNRLENPGNLREFGVELLPRFGGDNLRFGDLFDIDLLSSREAFLHLYLFQTSGDVMALAENMSVRGGEKTAFPPAKSGIRLRAHPPAGNNALLLIATTRPIAGTVARNYRPLGNPVRLAGSATNALQDIENQLRDIPAAEWRAVYRNITIRP